MSAPAPPPPAPSVRIYLYLGLAAVWSVSLPGPFQFDDYGVIVGQDAAQSLGGWWAGVRGLRPLLKLSFVLDSEIGGGAVGFHLTNILIHLMNVELVLRLYAAAEDPERRWPFRGAGTGAFAAAALFGIHPVQTEAVTYISGRGSSLMTLFLLLALLIYAEGARSHRPALWLGLSGAAFACAFLTKESAAVFPLALLLWEVCIERPGVRMLLARQGAWLLLAGGTLAWAVMQKSYYLLLYNMTGLRSLPDSLSHQTAGAGYLLSRLLLVHRLSIDPGLGFRPPSPGAIWGGGLLAAILLAAAVRQFRRRPVVAFGLLWLLLFLFLPYLVVPRMDVLNERHMYPANIGTFLAVGAVAAGVARRRPSSLILRGAAAGVVLLLAAATMRRSFDYRSEIALWETTARMSAGNPRAHNNLGVAYEKAGRAGEARIAYQRAIALEPAYDAARENLDRISRGGGRGGGEE